MATLNDAEALRAIWLPAELGRYEGRWIAFRGGEVLGDDDELGRLAARFADQMKGGRAPLFAYVTFEILQ